MVDALLGILIGAAVLAAVVLGGPDPLPTYCSSLHAEAVRRLPPWQPPQREKPC